MHPQSRCFGRGWKERHGPEHSYRSSSVEDPVPRAAHCEHPVYWKFFLKTTSLPDRAGADGGPISSSRGRRGTRRRAQKGQTKAWLHLGNDRSGKQLSAATRSLPKTQLHRPSAAAPGTRSAAARAARRGCHPRAPDRGVLRRHRGAGDTGSGSPRPL